jgi:hypothetical protein
LPLILKLSVSGILAMSVTCPGFEPAWATACMLAAASRRASISTRVGLNLPSISVIPRLSSVEILLSSCLCTIELTPLPELPHPGKPQEL